MKPFNLEKALAGVPVVLRGGKKAYIKYELPAEYSAGSPYVIIGYVVKADRKAEPVAWTKQGKFIDGLFDNYDIEGMWEEPRPSVQLELPCPLKEWVEGCYLIDDDFKIKRSTNGWYRKQLEEGRYFATEEDAQAWLNAMKNNRA